ncbi:hypothetical protein M5E88_02045 [Akkermansia muciniphila]|nr:hypothetical protein M5E88_02045 [Akkermansia muciniphila]
MFIIATARLATVKNALTVPAKSLLSTQGRFFVIVLDEGNHPSIIPVQAGTQLGDRQQVTPLKPDSLTPKAKWSWTVFSRRKQPPEIRPPA